jgi:type IV pilus assembly protein PilA
MLIRANEALAKRRSALKSEEGFTLIELLVVVIIIGILAAIAIPVYLGIQNNAKESATQTDVGNAKTAVIAYQTDKGTLPASGAMTAGTAAGQIDPKYGFTQSVSNTTAIKLYYTAGGTAFCVGALSSTGTSFAATDTLGVAKGSCTAAGAFSTTMVTTLP